MILVIIDILIQICYLIARFKVFNKPSPLSFSQEKEALNGCENLEYHDAEVS